jgi:hypothetical protein
MSALQYLASYIVGSLIVSVACFAIVAGHHWKRWPDPASYQTKYGRLVRRK